MKRGAVRAIVLDFDGVIIESNDAKTDAFRGVFARFPDLCEEMMAYHRSHTSASRIEKFDHLLRRLGRVDDRELRADLARDFSARTIDRIAAVPYVAGAERFLAEFAPRVPLYLASVTPAEDLAQILDKRTLTHWFRGVYGCPPWSKTDAVRDVLARERCAPDEAVLIGDSAGDQRVAEEVGVNFIARDSGLTFDTPPVLRVPDLDAAASLLRTWVP